ncbi:hypothetical protein Q3O43_29680 (plasmid) [Rhodococcus aetherivorans]|uniref:hypothetical protein n=1 Tax=Rhodococcus aetherivorans TaxID=191292 RepID=UPI0026ED935E|nr:hypothetical protein [Rhodococcus aetherivorans]WKX02047.1 hypothetical protein Q3O43_29680 [Rhodococcus aetherivorans]
MTRVVTVVFADGTLLWGVVTDVEGPDMLGQPGSWPTRVPRHAVETVERRTFAAGTRVEIVSMGVDGRVVDERVAGLTGTVVGDYPEVVWASNELLHLGPEHVLHRVLFDGAVETVTLSDRWLVRIDRPAPPAPGRTYRRPRLLERLGRVRVHPKDVTAARDVFYEIQARRRPPGQWVLVSATDIDEAVQDAVVLAGPVRVVWSVDGEGYELPAEVLHQVRFGADGRVEWVSDQRMV